MKWIELNPIISEPVGANDVVIQITHVRRSAAGLPEARVSVWNGRPLATDVIELDAATDRRRLAKEAAKNAPDMVPDVRPVEATLLKCAEALHELVPSATKSDSPSVPEEPRPSARFAGLVDIIADDEGEPKFLVIDQSNEAGVVVVRAHTPHEGPDANCVLVPPPARSLPWRLPRASEVLRYLRGDEGQDTELFEAIVAALERYSLLPALPAPHERAYYDLLAAWAFLTHYIEIAMYFAMIAFQAVPERGKSRTGRTLVYISRRGVHTETLREANLFRDSQDRDATLFIDCMGVWAKAQRLQCEDILLQRFERGARVARVLYPDRGAFLDTVYFDIFGPTILASNEPLGRILDTRCIPISMPLAQRGLEYPVPDEEALLPLRERLVAWRARQLLAGWQPAPMEKPAGSRLGDVLLPLRQIIGHVAPDRLVTFDALARHLEAERRQDRALSWESAIVAALAELREQVQNGLLLIGLLAERVNADRPEKEKLSNKRISDTLRALGFEMRKAHANKAAVVWDDAKVELLKEHYAQPSEGPMDEKDGDISAGTVGSRANHAHQANPESGRPSDNVDSMVSTSTGGTQQEFDGLFPDDPSGGSDSDGVCEVCGWATQPGERRCLEHREPPP